MDPSKSKLGSLPPQRAIVIKKSKSLKPEKKLYDYIDVNLDKSFVTKYFQASNKK
tara:strand:+ start:480 stop:644 length:165 start_codon:yes stop_codon:yes gene_type:complete